MNLNDHELYEIRLHGRGGQGVVLASIVLAFSFFKEGKFVQAFPSFGAERKGAPVVAFTRVSDREIIERFGIYKPNCLVIMDSSLSNREEVTNGLQDDGWIIINSNYKPTEFRSLSKFRVASIDANSIAHKYGLGKESSPIINTIILGAFARATKKVRIESVLNAIKEKVPSNAEKNVQAAADAYEKLFIN